MPGLIDHLTKHQLRQRLRQALHLVEVQGQVLSATHAGLLLPCHNFLAEFQEDFDTRRCRVCGCTEEHPCTVSEVDQDLLQVCCWVEWDLCSACRSRLRH